MLENESGVVWIGGCSGSRGDGYNICKIISEKTFAMLVDEKIYFFQKEGEHRKPRKYIYILFLCFFFLSVVSLNCWQWGGVGN